ncbi:MAG: hypothetical protein KME01_16160 [Chroococcus sp. CMT-3BRIN-NPC107]|jgi:hypothetical protein|nr:hypothetical protein [Chroococcus sp. CMT-3BRIN-NPC107]
MYLNPIQRKILSIIEPLPLQKALIKSTNLIETSQIGLGKTITKMLRLLRRHQPMNEIPGF